MKRQILIMLLNAVIIFGSVGVILNLVPLCTPAASAASVALARLAEPEYLLNRAKSEIATYIPAGNEHTTNTRVEQPVMHATGSADSNDGCTITDTPADVKRLMKEAEEKYSKKNAKGKTSEEPYLGGGTVIDYDGVQIQSKIPSSFYRPDIKALLKQGADLKIKDKSKPTILIYHSHTTEAYSLLDSGYYISSDSRSNDTAKNVARVGEELASYLEQAGFQVIHDTEIHDVDYNASYDSSRRTVEKYLEEYPSIEVTIDLHRDDITYSDKTKVKPTTVVDGKKAARMMLIAGCEYGRVQHFPDWEYNLRFDLAVQRKVNDLYPELMRPILFSERKYNMYETHNSFLLEIGTDANTLDEACYSARLFGKALGELLNEEYVNESKG